MKETKNAIILAVAAVVIVIVIQSVRCGGNPPQKNPISKEQQQRIDAELAQMRSNQAKALEASQKEQRCESNALGYLHSLMTGDSIAAAGFWKPGVSPKTLFAVESYREIRYGTYLMRGGNEYNPPRLFYKFEVESSTKGGFPIRKRWNIVMEPESKNYADWNCAIVDLVEGE
jgi:hypothetical protein